MQLESNAQLKPLITRYAALWAQLGKEFGKRPLVTPTSEFFPDPFEKSRAGVTRLLRRMQQHTAMTDIPIEVVLDAGGAQAAQSCGSGSCAPSQATDDARLLLGEDNWTLRVTPADIAHPVGLTTLLSSALATIFLEETRPDGASITAPAALTTELAAVGLGLGVLLLEGSYVYSKSCGGPSIAKLTQLGAGQLAPLVALFAAQHGHSLRGALGSVGTTQRAVLSEAKAWAKANRSVSKRLALDPAALEDGDFSLSEPSGSLFGFLGRKASDDEQLEEALLLASTQASHGSPRVGTAHSRSQAERRADPEDDDLKALVASVLSDRGAEPQS